MFGFLFVVSVILALTVSETTVLLCYFHLCAEVSANTIQQEVISIEFIQVKESLESKVKRVSVNSGVRKAFMILSDIGIKNNVMKVKAQLNLKFTG